MIQCYETLPTKSLSNLATRQDMAWVQNTINIYTHIKQHWLNEKHYNVDEYIKHRTNGLLIQAAVIHYINCTYV